MNGSTSGTMSGGTMGGTTSGTMSGGTMSGGTMGGSGNVTVQPSRPVNEAFPPPPPRDDYPVCSRTVQDSCRNPGGR
ncbi:hypothetical protein GGR88_001526 [Sphingomonas jejuensis]|uniref:Uncharacterized protein n=1 Tax=Sphingomonas jejuensis TaxID=904715 RepID=A0ABX0XMT1_9SPHN|nr:hypothetical protein [Sphingomonas jejuensis]NJC34052.1 hypothetical protein [Sphingomonas jejuensis]